MTLSTQAIKAVYQGNGATTVFAYTFPIPAQADLIVTLVTRSSGVEQVLAPSVYSTTGLGTALGGTVTYPLSGSPMSALYSLVIERFVPAVQSTNLVNQGGAYPADIEDALDYVTMIAQQLQDQIDRSIVFSAADSVAGTLPVASARQGLFMSFDVNGDPILVTGLSNGAVVSAAMIPVVTAATTAAALTALGLPGALLDLLIPAGTIWDFSLTSAPTGFVFPIGQACTGTYPTYRAALVAAGSPFGTNGTDPLMPDLRSYVVAGKSNMGGVDNGLLTGGTVLGAVLGTQTKVLLAANLPAYTPTGTVAVTVTTPNVLSGGTSDNYTSVAGAGTWNTPTRGALTATATFTGAAQGGTSTAFSIVQPTIILNKIIKVH